MKNLKYLALLIVNFILASGIYYWCITSNNPDLLIVMPIYQVLSIIGICTYVFLFLHHNNEIGKAKTEGRELDTAIIEKRRSGMKWCITAVLPVVVVTVWDYIYLLLLSDNPVFQKLLNLF